MADIRIYDMVNTHKPDRTELPVVTDNKNIVLNDAYVPGQVGFCYMEGGQWILSADPLSPGIPVAKQPVEEPRNWPYQLGAQVGTCTVIPVPIYDTVKQEVAARVLERSRIKIDYEAGVRELEAERDAAFAKKPDIDLVQRIQELM